jgi:ribosomal protein S18 acetylase RimI-like enzyme
VQAEIAITLGGRECIHDLEDLFAVLHEHQTAAAPTLAGMPARTTADTWPRRRAHYEEWLARPGAFVLVASRAERRVGYAVVSLTGGYQGWASSDRIGEVHDIAVLPTEQGQGIGSALMDRVEHELEQAGVREYRLNVIAANTSAVHFYERRGMTLISHVMLGRIDARTRSEPSQR